jgi:hypothetical protein
MARTRTKVSSTITGGRFHTYYNSTLVGTSYGGSGTAGSDVSVDTTMPPPYTTDHDLQIDHILVHPLRIYGTRVFTAPFVGYTRDYHGYNPTNRSLQPYAPVNSAPNFAYYKTKALANMNPGKPHVDLSLFLYEMKDFPRMLKNLGDFLLWERVSKGVKPSVIPDAYLSWSFGWGPLISDTLKLFDTAALVSQRARYFRALESGAHLRRSLGDIAPSDTYSAYGVEDITALSQIHRSGKAWYSANAHLTGPIPGEDLELKRLSFQTVYSLNLSPATVWNMLPWSWLIDYFYNVGDVLNAVNGSIPWTCTSMCVMVRQETTDKLIGVRCPSGVSVNSNAVMRRTTLHRKVYVNPTPVVTFRPFLTDGMIGNLASLATSAFLKAARS